MMVAASDGNISIASFGRYFFSMPATPRGGFDAGTLRRIKGSTATDQWQSGQRARLWLQFDFQEYDFIGGLVEHILLDARFSGIGFSQSQPSPCRPPLSPPHCPFP